MSDGLPTDEQLRRIERGVRHRIELRRRVARGIVGATAGVLLLAGGIAVVRPTATDTAGSASGSALSSGTDVPEAAAPYPVECHAGSAADSHAVQVEARGPGATAAVAACADPVEFQSGAGRMPSAGTSGGDRAAPLRTSAQAVVVCRARDDVLHVFPPDAHPATLCRRNGMQPG